MRHSVGHVAADCPAGRQSADCPANDPAPSRGPRPAGVGRARCGSGPMVLDRLDECSIRLWPGRDDDGLTSRQSTPVDLMQQGVEVGELSGAGSGQQDPRVDVEVRQPVLPAREVHDEGVEARATVSNTSSIASRGGGHPEPARRERHRQRAQRTRAMPAGTARADRGRPHRARREIGPAEPFDVVDAARHVDPTAGEVEIDEQGCLRTRRPAVRRPGSRSQATGCTGDDEGRTCLHRDRTPWVPPDQESRPVDDTPRPNGPVDETPDTGDGPGGDRGRRGVPNSGEESGPPSLQPEGERWVQYIGAIACAQAVKPNS